MDKYSNDTPLLNQYYSLRSIKILIIDDDEGLCNSIKFFFEDHESEVYACNNGETGLQLFEKHKPHIVLVDLNMPGMGGHNVVANLSRNYPDIPVIVVSGTGVIKEAIRSIKLGAWDFVTKPILNFEELELSVLRALEKSFLIKENKSYKENLEKLVEERTAQLNKKSEELQNLLVQYKIAMEKAEESNRLKTAFLNNMSHEIRTPLNVIQGYAQLLKEDFTENEYINELTCPILKNTNQLLQIIDDILNISIIETGQARTNLARINANLTIRECIEEQMNLAVQKRLELSINSLLDENDSYIITDPLMLRQVLKNLIRNGIKYTESGYVKISAQRNSGWIQFSVQDTGIGIEQKDFQSIFERFRRVEEYTTDKYSSSTHGGTGLGLSICKGWLELLGGKIWLDSEPGKGTTFYFTIPVSEELFTA